MVDANTVFLSIQIIIFLTFVACLLVGDTYITYMIFNSSSYSCEGFDNPSKTNTPIISIASPNASSSPASSSPTSSSPAKVKLVIPPSKITLLPPPKPILPPAPKLTARAKVALVPKLNNYSVCYNLTDTQIGFTKFKIILFWITFAAITLGALVLLYKAIGNNEVLFAILASCLIVLSVFILVGGIYTTQYVFYGENKNCIMPSTTATTTATATAKSTSGKAIEYCINLNDTKMSFAKMSVVFGWIYSIITIFSIGSFIFQANLG
jgi:hypothetical protein